MPIQYFGAFPIVEYTLTKDSMDAKTVVDITKRVGIRSDFSDYVSSYYKHIVSDSRPPEQYARSAYGSTLDHWILLHVNGVVDPYFDWVLDGNKFNDYIQKRYPNEVLIYDISTLSPDGSIFIIGETITGSVSTATAIVKDYNPDLGQIVYENSLDPDWDLTDVITGSTSGVSADVDSTVKEFAAPRFYEVVRDNGDGSVDRLVVDKGFNDVERAKLPGGISSWAAPIAIDNVTYEDRLNEEKREINLLNTNLVETFEEDFKKKIR